MKSFIASTLAAIALAIKVKDTTQTDAAPATGDMPDLEDWEWEAMGLYYCLDSHGEEDGVVSLLELAGGLHAGVEAGVIPEEFVDSFGENVDFTGLLADHLTAEEAAACNADGDEKLMAGEFGECVEAHIDELVAGEDWEGLEEAMQRLHAVEIPIELAGEGMEAAMEGTGAPREEWAAHIGGAAQACWDAHHDDREDDHEDWHDPAMSLGMCIDLHGNGDGQLQAGELIGAFEHLHEEGMMSDDLVEALKAEAPEDIEEDDVVEWEHAGEVIEFILEHEEVPREEWADAVAGVADYCWSTHEPQEGTSGSSTTDAPPSTTDVPATALAQIKAKYGRL